MKDIVSVLSAGVSVARRYSAAPSEIVVSVSGSVGRGWAFFLRSMLTAVEASSGARFAGTDSAAQAAHSSVQTAPAFASA